MEPQMTYSDMTDKQLTEANSTARQVIRDVASEKRARLAAKAWSMCLVTERPLQGNNTSGKAGVTYNANAQRWQAKIRGVYIGNFEEKEAAIEARLRAEANISGREGAEIG
tara:strand:- start:633 stop:965 length:333 start_codon:yes stop_codon:yes gene_type:complete